VKLTMKLFLSMVLAAGAALIVTSLFNLNIRNIGLYLTYLALACAGACMKVRLPNIRGTFSLNFFFVLITLAGLSYPEAVTIACISIVVQCCWRAVERPQITQVVFNVATMAMSVAAAQYASQVFRSAGNPFAVAIAAATAYFVMNTVLVSTVLAISAGRRISVVWQHWFLWSFPYYAIGAGIAAALGGSALGGSAQRPIVAAILPAMYLIYRYYRLYIQSRSDTVPASIS
jgi:hypothetical protein